MNGLCECGCGARTNIARQNCAERGWVKGQPRRYLRGHQLQNHPRTDPILRFWSHVDRTGDCWLWTSAKLPHGYGQFRLVPGETMRKAHRLSYEWAHGPIPEGMGVLHRCDNPSCVNPDHLFTGTQLDNMRDCRAKNRMPLGGQRADAKLTVDDVRRIRILAKSQSLNSIAREYGVSQPTIRSAVNGTTWAWVA
jgi:hypothetical protein